MQRSSTAVRRVEEKSFVKQQAEKHLKSALPTLHK
jgi:hypothetical protein